MVIKLGWGMQALAFWMNPLGKEFLLGDTEVGPWLSQICGEYRYHWLVCDSDFASNCLCPLYYAVKSTCEDFVDGSMSWLYLNMYLMSVRMTSVSGSYLNCTWNMCWMSVRMTSVSGLYPNYIWKLNLNEYQNGIRIWSVSELYLKGILNKYQNSSHI